MKSYSDLVDRVFLNPDLMKQLLPRQPLDREMLRRVQSADDLLLSGGQKIGDLASFQLVRGGTLYALDAIDEAHKVFQEAHSDLGSYWHGMIHRREGDFDNARYWFRRAGTLSFFAQIQSAACEHSALMARQENWDPYLFTGECEQERFGAEELTSELLVLQRLEFELLFEYCWRKSRIE